MTAVRMAQAFAALCGALSMVLPAAQAMKALGDIKGAITPDRVVMPSLAHLVN